MTRSLVIAALLWATTAQAHPVVLRIATVAPDGTLWARELKAFATQIASQTNDAVHVKWIFGGIAGDEGTLDDRIHRGQIDGAASGGPMCQKFAPTLRLFSSPGLFIDRNESSYVLGRLYSKVADEFAKNGYVMLGLAGVGPMMVFSRQPLKSMTDLQRQKLWVWTEQAWFTDQWKALGVQPVNTPIYEAGRAYSDGRVDAMISTPTAALAFQWTTLTPNLSELRIGFLNGCVIVSSRVFDSLPHDAQLVVRSAAAKLNRRFEDAGRVQDEALLGGLLARHGVHISPVDATFRSEFFERARAMRDRLHPEILPPDLLAQVQALLADYRAEHSASAR